MASMISRLNGNLTGPSAAIIAVVLILGQFGIIGNGDDSNTDVAFRTQVSLEHGQQFEHSKDLATEVKALADVTKEMVIILRDMKAEQMRKP